MLDVGLDGAADDRARADDRDLDDQVLQLARLGARQHLDLGAALDLEGADRVAGADHVVDARVVEVDPAEVDRRLAVVDDQSRHSSTSESMPRARKSILTIRASSQESLSHWQRKRPSIAAGWIGTSSLSGVRGDDHAADVLGDVAREVRRAGRPARSGSDQGGRPSGPA